MDEIQPDLEAVLCVRMHACGTPIRPFAFIYRKQTLGYGHSPYIHLLIVEDPVLILSIQCLNLRMKDTYIKVNSASAKVLYNH